jgi:hypothetical protein
LPLPQVQYRPPIIIHTYSPKVIHTQPDDFMSLVQKLTGSSDTRLRLKRKPSSKKAVSVPASGGGDGSSDKVDLVTDLEQQGMSDGSSFPSDPLFPLQCKPVSSERRCFSCLSVRGSN